MEHAVFADTIMPSFSRFLMTTTGTSPIVHVSVARSDISIYTEWEDRQGRLSGSTTTSRAASATASTSHPDASESATSGGTPGPHTERAGPAKPAKNKKSKSSRKVAKKSKSSSQEGLFETETETETETEEEEEEEEEGDEESDSGDESQQEDSGTPLATALPDGVDVPTPDDLGLNDAMVRKLDAMPEDERRIFLWLHRKSTEYDIQCLNTRAANDELLQSLGVDADFLAPKKQASKKAASKKAVKKGARAPQEAAEPGRRSARLNKEASAPSSSSSSPSPSPSPSPASGPPDTEDRASEAAAATASSAEARARAASAAVSSSEASAPGTTTSSRLTGSPAPASTASPIASVPTPGSEPEAPTSLTSPPTRSSTLQSAPTQPSTGGELSIEVDFDPKSLATLKTYGWSDWGKKAFAHFTEQSYSDDFARAVFRWAALEDRFGWEKSAKGYRAQLRPTAIADWMRLDRRVHAKVPKLPPVEEYAASWWAWWISLQPEWRAMDSAGRPLRNGEGPWDDLVQPGQNGMLLVLLSLVWWHGIAPESSRGDWDAAVRDVAWVLDQMVLAQVKAPSKYVFYLHGTCFAAHDLSKHRKRKDDASPKPAAKRARKN